MIAGLALVLSLAAPQLASTQGAPAPASEGTAALAHRVVRPADAPPPIVIEAPPPPPPEAKSETSAPDPSAEELERQIDALRAENAEKLQREIDALREQSRTPPLHPAQVPTSPEKLQLQIDALQEQSTDRIAQEINLLQKQRPSLAPPLILLGAGVVFVVAAVAVSQQCNPATDFCFESAFTGVGLGIAGLALGVGGLVLLAVEAAVRGNIDKQIEALEAQMWSASSGVRVTPWVRGGAGGLALSLALP